MERTHQSRGGLPLFGLLLTAVAGWPSTASAYRPFDGTDAGVAPRGELELEIGPLGGLVEGSRQALVAPRLVLNWGLAGRWEVVLEGSHLVELGAGARERRPRIDDTALSLKGLLREGSLQEKSGLSVATEAGALLPTLRGEPGVGAEWALIVSQRVRDLSVHLNGAVSWTRAHVPALSAGIILEGHDAWAVRPVAEVFIEGERGSPAAVSGLVGTIWRAQDGLSFDAGFRLARAGGVNTTELRLGLTWGFSVGFPR